MSALARVLADGLQDEAKLDTSWLIIQALADMENIHIRALAKLAGYPTDSELTAQSPDNTEAVNESPIRKRRMNFFQSLPAPVANTLIRHGLANQVAGYGLYVDGVSDYGREVLRYLGSAADSLPETLRRIERSVVGVGATPVATCMPARTSPAAGAPLGDRGAFGERAVAAVARVELGGSRLRHHP